MRLLNKKQLGQKMGKGPGFVAAMIEFGYEMEFGNQTTLAHALRWRRRNPDFRTTSYYRRHRTGLKPRHRSRLADAPAAIANRSGELVRSNGRCNP